MKEFIPDFSVHLLQSVVAVDGSTTEPITEELSSSILLSREKRLLLLLFRGGIFFSFFLYSFFLSVELDSILLRKNFVLILLLLNITHIRVRERDLFARDAAKRAHEESVSVDSLLFFIE